MIISEQKLYENVSKEFQSYTKKYLEPSRQRLEVFQPPYPEKNGDYYYYSKLASYETNDYEIIYRKNPKKVKENIKLKVGNK